jgi:hypothetical protein
MKAKRRWLLGALALVLVAAVSIPLIGTALDSDADPSVRGNPDPKFATSGLVRVADVPARHSPALTWTGRNLLVFGGYRPQPHEQRQLLDDGWIIDVETGASDPLPSPPFAAPLLSPAVTRSGDRVVVAGIECADYSSEPDSDAFSCAATSGRLAVAAFDPRSRSWSSTSRPPGLDGLNTVTARGTTRLGFYVPQILGVASGDTYVSISVNGRPQQWSYGKTGSWTPLPDANFASPVCAIGSRVVGVAPQTSADGGVSLRSVDLAAASRPPTDGPPVAMARPAFPSVSCLGSDVMLLDSTGVDQRAGAHLFDTETQQWAAVPPPSSNSLSNTSGGSFSFPSPSDAAQRVWTGAELLLISDFQPPRLEGVPPGPDRLPGHAYLPDRNAWRELPEVPGPMPSPQWAGNAAVDYENRNGRSFVVHYVPS